MRDITTTIIGNATSDPRATSSHEGKDSAMVGIAVNSSFFDPDRQEFRDRKAEYLTVFASGALARNLLASVRKGQPLIATGRFGSSEWTDNDGTARTTLRLQAESIGHDLNRGTSTFVKPVRLEDMPEFDRRTGEVVPEGGGEGDQLSAAGTDPLSAGESEGDGDLVAAGEGAKVPF